MKKFKRIRTYNEIKKLCKEQKVPFDDRLYREQGYDTVVVGGSHPARGYVIFNTFNGRFWGQTPEGVKFDSDSAKHDSKPWMQALLNFFYADPV